MSIQDYPHPALTADVVLFAVGQRALRVLLVQRDKPPFEGHWAFPGGFVNVGEAPRDAARRELEEETHVQDVVLEQLRAFGDLGRDPRGHVVTIAYLGVIRSDALRRARAGSDAAQVRWWSLDELPSLAFDHAEVLAYALRRLRSKLTCVTEAADVLPGDLTLGELRAACEIAGRMVRPTEWVKKEA
jgi:8-oxo-dGTP diphosphatase